jgi:hypothetical protein
MQTKETEGKGLEGALRRSTAGQFGVQVPAPTSSFQLTW